MQTRLHPALVAAAMLLAANSVAAAEDPLSRRFSVTVGGFWPDVDTTVRVDSSGGRLGTELDFESDLGLDDRDTMWTGGLNLRLGKRHYIDLLYFKLDRDGQRPVDIDFSFGDRQIVRQSSVDSFFDTEVVRLSYGFAFINNEHHRLLGQLGLHYTRVAAGITVPGAATPLAAEADSNVPLPVIGLDYDYHVNPRFSLALRAQVFRLEFENLDGSLDNFSADLQYAFTPRFAMFVGYNYYSIDVDADQDHWHGAFDFRYHGPWAGAVVGFGAAP